MTQMSALTQAVVAALVLTGTFFMVVASLGVLRMPDLFTRMHAATKAGTLGASILLMAAALAFRTTSVTMRCLAIIAFLCLIAPLAAHLVGRAAYFYGGIRLWQGTTINEVPQDPGQAEE